MNDKLIQVKDKFYQKCQVIILPTNKASNLFIDNGILCFNPKNSNIEFTDVIYQHLYIISSEEIKESNQYLIYEKQVCKTFKYGEKREICFKINNKVVYCQNNKWRKIIATTDELKTHTTFAGDYRYDHFLPRPSDDFLKAFVKAQGKIDRVLVEYDVLFFIFIYEDEEQGKAYKLKVSRDNTITIKPVQQIYVSEKALPFVVEALGFDPTKQFEKQEKFGKRVIEYCKKYEGTDKYNVAMLAIQEGYQLAQEEIEDEFQQKENWTKKELQFLKDCKERSEMYCKDNVYREQQIQKIFKWIEENL